MTEIWIGAVWFFVGVLAVAGSLCFAWGLAKLIVRLARDEWDRWE